MKRLRSSPKEIDRFRKLIQQMSRDSLIYKMLKKELSALGYWKNRKRGRHA